MKNENDKLIDNELEKATNILTKYIPKEDSVKLTFHLMNIMREINK